MHARIPQPLRMKRLVAWGCLCWLLALNESMNAQEGDVRSEYVGPIRWTKPGVLLLEQLSIFRAGEIDDAKSQLTAGLDPKAGKFKVIYKKKLPPDVKKED
jgi:hypothetical protein